MSNAKQPNANGRTSESSAANSAIMTPLAQVDDPAGVATEAPILDVTVVTPLGQRVVLKGLLSTSESLINVREFLAARPETCHFTCYKFVFLTEGENGKIEHLLGEDAKEVNDYLEFSRIPALANHQHIILRMEPKRYTLREVREHVWRLRNVVKNPPQTPRQVYEYDSLDSNTGDTAKSGEIKSVTAKSHQSNHKSTSSHSTNVDASGTKASSSPNSTNLQSQDHAGATENQNKTGNDNAVKTNHTEGKKKIDIAAQRAISEKMLKEAKKLFPTAGLPVEWKLEDLQTPNPTMTILSRSENNQVDRQASNSAALNSPVSTDILAMAKNIKGNSNDHNNNKTSRKRGRKGKHKGKNKGRGNHNNEKKKKSTINAKKGALPRCFKSICFSGFNPPPMQRQLLGDLCYLELTTEEDNKYVITAAPDGFFVNSSRDQDIFNARPAYNPHHSHTILELLSKVSPIFREKFKLLLQQAQSAIDQFQDDTAFLTLPWSNASSLSSSNAAGAGSAQVVVESDTESWLSALPKVHNFDLNRSEESMRVFGIEHGSTSALRDWNEEYQCCKELPRRTTEDRILRARALSKMMHEFRQAAREGAIAIMRGKIPPINPHDEPRCYVFVLNSIFFSFAVDVREIFSDCGGDRTAAALAMRDLMGVRQLNELDEPGLHTLATVIIDYLGHRIVAQSIVPGILHGEQASALEYGSVDRGRTLHFSEQMHKIMDGVAKKLNIETSQVLANKTPLPATVAGSVDTGLQSATDAKADSVDDKNNKFHVKADFPVKLNGPVDSKGIIGSDARHYILDVMRLTPKDPRYADNASANVSPDAMYTACFRRELVRDYQCHLLLKKRQAENIAAAEKAAAAKKKAVEESASTVNNDDPKAASSPAMDHARDSNGEGVTKQSSNTEDVGKNIEPLEDQSVLLKFDVNVFTEHEHALDKEELAKREGHVRDLGIYLTRKVLPRVAKMLLTGQLTCGDGKALVTTMHQVGVNVRYLGALANLVALVSAGRKSPSQSLEKKGDNANASSAGGASEDKEVKTAASTIDVAKQDEDDQEASAEITPGSDSNVKVNENKKKSAQSIRRGVFVIVTAEIEMIARAVKGIVGELLRNNRSLLDAPAVVYSAILSCLISRSAFSAVKPTENKKTQKKQRKNKNNGHQQEPQQRWQSSCEKTAHARLSELALTPKSMWNDIRQRVKDKFHYQLRFINQAKLVPGSDLHSVDGEFNKHRLQLVRRVCQKCGFSIFARLNYDLSSPQPFSTEDIANVFPVCKDSSPNCALSDIRQYLERGMQVMARRAVLQHAFDCVHEALVLLYQVCGASHRDTAVCYQTLASILYQANDSGAIMHQQRAVVLFSKICGADHLDTAQALSNLAKFQHRFGQTADALRSLQRCIFIVELAVGPRSLFARHYYKQMGRVYLDIGQTEMATKCNYVCLCRAIENGDAFSVAEAQELQALTHHSAARFIKAYAEQKKACLQYSNIYGAKHAALQPHFLLLRQMYINALEEQKFDEPNQGEAVSALTKSNTSAVSAPTSKNIQTSKNNKK
jgi:protein TIF31